MNRIKNTNWEEIQKIHNNGISWTRLPKEIGISMTLLKHAEKLGLIKKVYYERIFTEEQRKNISEKLKLAHMEGRMPGWSAVNSDPNKRSYPEKFFYSIFKKAGLFKKYKIIEKMPFFKYNLDFAIVDLKLDIEIDGEQHFSSIDAISHDIERNKFVISKGWKVYRICWRNFIKNKEKEIEELFNFIENIKNKTSRFYNFQELLEDLNKRNYKIEEINGQFKFILQKKYKTVRDYHNHITEKAIEKNKKKVSKIISSDINFSRFGWVTKASQLIGISPSKVNVWMKKYMPDFYKQKCFVRESISVHTCLDCGKKIQAGSTRCKECNSIFRRKTKRPPLEQIKKDVENYGYSCVAIKYKISRNTLKKWIKQYEKDNKNLVYL